MHHATDHRRASGRRGLATTATAAAACACALFLATGCQPSPRVSGFSDTPAQQVAAARLQQAGGDEALMPFDEKFYVPPAEDAGASAP